MPEAHIPRLTIVYISCKFATYIFYLLLAVVVEFVAIAVRSVTSVIVVVVIFSLA